MVETRRVQNSNIMSQIEKEDYIKVIEDMPWLYEPILGEIDKHSNKIGSILDVGCGNGLLLSFLFKKYSHIRLMGVDADAFFIEKVKDKTMATFAVANGYTFSQNADLIISNLALHHFEDPNKLLEHMIEQSGYGIIVSDQVRPGSEEDLERRLELRLKKHKFDRSEYYKDHGRVSILEAYSRIEIEKILEDLGLPVNLRFIDDDYFERFVATIIK